jgi:glycosyltransferase involved in cell wall biosynthesis
MARVWQGLAEAFARRGHLTKIIARAYLDQPSRETINGVTYIRAGGFSQGRHIGLDLVKDFAYALHTLPRLPKADILVTNDFWLPALAQRLRRNAGRIVVNVNRFPKGQFFLYRGVSRLAAASRAIEAAITEECPDLKSRICVFPNPIDTRAFSFLPTLQTNKDRKTILYVGRIHPEKGLDILISALTYLKISVPTAKLRIVGPHKEEQGGGGKGYLDCLKSKAAGLDVSFDEPVFEPERLAGVYQTADLFCYPSIAEKGEAFPVAPLEAMASGLVPIVSNLGCFRDFIDEGKSGYYFDHQCLEPARRLAEVIRSAIEDSQGTAAMSLNAARRAQEFSYERVADSYLKDFSKLVYAGAQ